MPRLVRFCVESPGSCFEGAAARWNEPSRRSVQRQTCAGQQRPRELQQPSQERQRTQCVSRRKVEQHLRTTDRPPQSHYPPQFRQHAWRVLVRELHALPHQRQQQQQRSYELAVRRVVPEVTGHSSEQPFEQQEGTRQHQPRLQEEGRQQLLDKSGRCGERERLPLPQEGQQQPSAYTRHQQLEDDVVDAAERSDGRVTARLLWVLSGLLRPESAATVATAFGYSVVELPRPMQGTRGTRSDTQMLSSRTDAGGQLVDDELGAAALHTLSSPILRRLFMRLVKQQLTRLESLERQRSEADIRNSHQQLLLLSDIEVSLAAVVCLMSPTDIDADAGHSVAFGGVSCAGVAADDAVRADAAGDSDATNTHVMDSDAAFAACGETAGGTEEIGTVACEKQPLGAISLHGHAQEERRVLRAFFSAAVLRMWRDAGCSSPRKNSRSNCSSNSESASRIVSSCPSGCCGGSRSTSRIEVSPTVSIQTRTLSGDPDTRQHKTAFRLNSHYTLHVHKSKFSGLRNGCDSKIGSLDNGKDFSRGCYSPAETSLSCLIQDERGYETSEYSTSKVWSSLSSSDSDSIFQSLECIALLSQTAAALRCVSVPLLHAVMEGLSAVDAALQHAGGEQQQQQPQERHQQHLLLQKQHQHPGWLDFVPTGGRPRGEWRLVNDKHSQQVKQKEEQREERIQPGRPMRKLAPLQPSTAAPLQLQEQALAQELQAHGDRTNEQQHQQNERRTQHTYEQQRNKGVICPVQPVEDRTRCHWNQGGEETEVQHQENDAEGRIQDCRKMEAMCTSSEKFKAVAAIASSRTPHPRALSLAEIENEGDRRRSSLLPLLLRHVSMLYCSLASLMSTTAVRGAAALRKLAVEGRSCSQSERTETYNRAKPQQGGERHSSLQRQASRLQQPLQQRELLLANGQQRRRLVERHGADEQQQSQHLLETRPGRLQQAVYKYVSESEQPVEPQEQGMQLEQNVMGGEHQMKPPESTDQKPMQSREQQAACVFVSDRERRAERHQQGRQLEQEGLGSKEQKSFAELADQHPAQPQKHYEVASVQKLERDVELSSLGTIKQSPQASLSVVTPRVSRKNHRRLLSFEALCLLLRGRVLASRLLRSFLREPSLLHPHHAQQAHQKQALSQQAAFRSCQSLKKPGQRVLQHAGQEIQTLRDVDGTAWGEQSAIEEDQKLQVLEQLLRASVIVAGSASFAQRLLEMPQQGNWHEEPHIAVRRQLLQDQRKRPDQRGQAPHAPLEQQQRHVQSPQAEQHKRRHPSQYSEKHEKDSRTFTGDSVLPPLAGPPAQNPSCANMLAELQQLVVQEQQAERMCTAAVLDVMARLPKTVFITPSATLSPCSVPAPAATKKSRGVAAAAAATGAALASAVDTTSHARAADKARRGALATREPQASTSASGAVAVRCSRDAARASSLAWAVSRLRLLNCGAGPLRRYSRALKGLAEAVLSAAIGGSVKMLPQRCATQQQPKDAPGRPGPPVVLQGRSMQETRRGHNDCAAPQEYQQHFLRQTPLSGDCGNIASRQEQACLPLTSFLGLKRCLNVGFSLAVGGCFHEEFFRQLINEVLTLLPPQQAGAKDTSVTASPADQENRGAAGGGAPAKASRAPQLSRREATRPETLQPSTQRENGDIRDVTVTVDLLVSLLSSLGMLRLQHALVVERSLAALAQQLQPPTVAQRRQSQDATAVASVTATAAASDRVFPGRPPVTCIAMDWIASTDASSSSSSYSSVSTACQNNNFHSCDAEERDAGVRESREVLRNNNSSVLQCRKDSCIGNPARLVGSCSTAARPVSDAVLLQVLSRVYVALARLHHKPPSPLQHLVDHLLQRLGAAATSTDMNTTFASIHHTSVEDAHGQSVKLQARETFPEFSDAASADVGGTAPSVQRSGIEKAEIPSVQLQAEKVSPASAVAASTKAGDKAAVVHHNGVEGAKCSSVEARDRGGEPPGTAATPTGPGLYPMLQERSTFQEVAAIGHACAVLQSASPQLLAALRKIVAAWLSRWVRQMWRTPAVAGASNSNDAASWIDSRTDSPAGDRASGASSFDAIADEAGASLSGSRSDYQKKEAEVELGQRKGDQHQRPGQQHRRQEGARQQRPQPWMTEKQVYVLPLGNEEHNPRFPMRKTGSEADAKGIVGLFLWTFAACNDVSHNVYFRLLRTAADLTDERIRGTNHFASSRAVFNARESRRAAGSINAHQSDEDAYTAATLPKNSPTNPFSHTMQLCTTRKHTPAEQDGEPELCLHQQLTATGSRQPETSPGPLQGEQTSAQRITRPQADIPLTGGLGTVCARPGYPGTHARIEGMNAWQGLKSCVQNARGSGEQPLREKHTPLRQDRRVETCEGERKHLQERDSEATLQPGQQRLHGADDKWFTQVYHSFLALAAHLYTNQPDCFPSTETALAGAAAACEVQLETVELWKNKSLQAARPPDPSQLQHRVKRVAEAAARQLAVPLIVEMEVPVCDRLGVTVDIQVQPPRATKSTLRKSPQPQGQHTTRFEDLSTRNGASVGPYKGAERQPPAADRRGRDIGGGFTGAGVAEATPGAADTNHKDHAAAAAGDFCELATHQQSALRRGTAAAGLLSSWQATRVGGATSALVTASPAAVGSRVHVGAATAGRDAFPARTGGHADCEDVLVDDRAKTIADAAAPPGENLSTCSYPVAIEVLGPQHFCLSATAPTERAASGTAAGTAETKLDHAEYDAAVPDYCLTPTFGALQQRRMLRFPCVKDLLQPQQLYTRRPVYASGSGLTPMQLYYSLNGSTALKQRLLQLSGKPSLFLSSFLLEKLDDEQLQQVLETCITKLSFAPRRPSGQRSRSSPELINCHAHSGRSSAAPMEDAYTRLFRKAWKQPCALSNFTTLSWSSTRTRIHSSRSRYTVADREAAGQPSAEEDSSSALLRERNNRAVTKTSVGGNSESSCRWWGATGTPCCSQNSSSCGGSCAPAVRCAQELCPGDAMWHACTRLLPSRLPLHERPGDRRRIELLHSGAVEADAVPSVSLPGKRTVALPSVAIDEKKDGFSFPGENGDIDGHLHIGERGRRGTTSSALRVFGTALLRDYVGGAGAAAHRSSCARGTARHFSTSALWRSDSWLRSVSWWPRPRADNAAAASTHCCKCNPVFAHSDPCDKSSKNDSVGRGGGGNLAGGSTLDCIATGATSQSKNNSRRKATARSTLSLCARRAERQELRIAPRLLRRGAPQPRWGLDRRRDSFFSAAATARKKSRLTRFPGQSTYRSRHTETDEYIAAAANLLQRNYERLLLHEERLPLMLQWLLAMARWRQGQLMAQGYAQQHYALQYGLQQARTQLQQHEKRTASLLTPQPCIYAVAECLCDAAPLVLLSACPSDQEPAIHFLRLARAASGTVAECKEIGAGSNRRQDAWGRGGRRGDIRCQGLLLGQSVRAGRFEQQRVDAWLSRQWDVIQRQQQQQEDHRVHPLLLYPLETLPERETQERLPFKIIAHERLAAWEKMLALAGFPGSAGSTGVNELQKMRTLLPPPFRYTLKSEGEQ